MKPGDDVRIIEAAEKDLKWHRAENDMINDGVVEELLDLAKRQQAALAPFVEAANLFEPDEGDGDQYIWGDRILVKHLRAARDLPPADPSAPPSDAKRWSDPAMKVEIKEDPTEPNRFTLIGQRHGADRQGRSWVASILMNGEPDTVTQYRMVQAMAAGLEGRPYRDEEFREVLADRDNMRAERDEADRRAGAAERELAASIERRAP